MSSIQDLRRQIDAIDDQLLDLLSRRARLAQEVGHSKSRTSAQFFAPEREQQILRRLFERNPGPLPREAVGAIFREIISASLALEERLQIAYLGPAGTFSHRAALSKFGASSEPKPVDTIPDVFTEVERGRAHYGVVPVENSTEGVVPYTLDMFSQTPLKVCAEVFVPVHHHLATRAESLAQVKRLYAHPQSLAQSRAWLRNTFRGRDRGRHLQQPVGADGGCGLRRRRDLHRHRRRDLQGPPDRRAHRGLAPQPDALPRDRPQRAAALGQGQDVDLLLGAPQGRGAAAGDVGLHTYNINLTMIESRPTKQMPWEYVFFIDFQGHVRTSP
jgi:chorismate mutase/prephenate dehydratase